MIVFTVASGNIGSKLTALLLSLGQRVRCAARRADKMKELEAKGAEIYACSLADTASLIKAFKGADAVFAMIPQSYYTNSSCQGVPPSPSRSSLWIGTRILAEFSGSQNI